MRELRKKSIDDLMITSYPLKYLGIELGDVDKRGKARTRFPLSTVLRIALRPRRMDGASNGLIPSNHRKAFEKRFPDIDAGLSARAIFDAAPSTDLASDTKFRRSRYAKLVMPSLKLLQETTAIPLSISLQVLRKGLAAYLHGHRPGMTAHGWARARLTSFVMKGCTHWFPDHLLAQKCPKKTQVLWDTLPCLCRKKAQCGQYGKRTRANA